MPRPPARASTAGTVKAHNERCAKRRTVQLYDVSQPSPFFLGATRTDAQGDYELIEFLPATGGQVQILVPEAKKGKHRCGALQTTATTPAPPAP